MPGESGLLLDGGVTPGELQPLLHSTSDSMLRKLVASNTETCIDMENVANDATECDTDSNKTEVEEIEMVDMEGREVEDTAEQADDETTPLLQARHRMETRGRVVSWRFRAFKSDTRVRKGFAWV